MEGLNSEVANKMRSAVKAKLIELGSGTAGYIDDELPDYVMIMVANKRSKEQMTGDLSLFLGKNTDIFVNWLHQVLDKLEEVTLPSTAVQQKKRKTSESEKRDKRNKLNRKRSVKEKTPEQTIRSTTPPIQSAPPSITDVFADHLIQKAKKVIEPPLSVKKAEARNGADDNFDIPTISEIAKKSMTTVVRKEITELAELQKKIDQAKRQLSRMTDESDDEDFINLRTDRIDFDAGLDANNSNEANRKDDIEPKQPAPLEKPQEIQESEKKRSSVHDRLGLKGKKTIEEKPVEKIDKIDKIDKSDKNENIISLSAHRRMEQAIYVPAHRRNAEQSTRKPERDRSLDRSDDRRLSMRENRLGSANRSRKPVETMDLREKVRQRNRDNEQRTTRSNRDMPRERAPRDKSSGGGGGGSSSRNDPKSSIVSRIGSRVIVAQTKVDDVEDDDGEVQVPVNSVVKVQPRPTVPKNRQASKNLLLRAVAEAQKSIASAKPAAKPFKATERKELYTKSFRKNFQKDHIVVEVATNPVIDLEQAIDSDASGNEEEYIPTSGSMDEDSLVYIPQVIHGERLDESPETKTQFVVTLDSLEFRTKKRTLQRNENETEIKRTRTETKSIQVKTEKRATETDSEGELRKAVENSNNKRTSLKRKRTPIRFDIDENAKTENSEPATKRRSRSNDRKSTEKSSSYRRSEEKEGSRGRDDRDESSSKIRTLKTQNKYDNLPPLSSAITVTQNENKSIQKKERCKFYPACTRGERCDYIHPSTPCKAFPNCKFGDMCLYIHPKCKFDLTCSRLNCNYSHTPVTSAAPPLASHVVPVSNYKKISANPLPTLCRFYPNCSNTLCEFYHPKPCKFGKNCTNKIECNFYHFDLPVGSNPAAVHPSKNKLKWVASAV